MFELFSSFYCWNNTGPFSGWFFPLFVPESSVSSFVTQLLFGLSPAFIFLVLACSLMHMSFECKNQSLFSLSKDSSLWVKGWILDHELVTYPSQQGFIFPRELIPLCTQRDSSHLKLLISFWFEMKCLYYTVYGISDFFSPCLCVGMQVLEWNGIILTGKTYEEVQGLVGQPCSDAEVCVRLWV